MMLWISERRLSWSLGLAGLIPFITGGVLAWSAPLGWQATAINGFVYYSAVILSFLGGAHWGSALQVLQPSSRWRLLLAMLPSLIAWPALLLNVGAGLWVLLAGFILMGGYDFSRAGRDGFPSWYPVLRGFLTAVVVLLHVVVLVRLNG
ncbi:DUF3429 domain-containing protein [Halomonas sp. FeN2]|uniref:DUF3429 domain-containing protein n=1 Tax=Halomonadaceae TaxID=28256 RepID=UPI001D09E411|nr:DUF3429 domain-containing protein [Halomonas sp. FeN2]UBR50621.1 DUF3429 domain-containing protein [Halomonas sp. FeN2]